MKNCFYCGVALNDNVPVCNRCGADQTIANNSQRPQFNPQIPFGSQPQFSGQFSMQPEQPAPKKSKKGLILGLFFTTVALASIIYIVITFAFAKKDNGTTANDPKSMTKAFIKAINDGKINKAQKMYYNIDQASEQLDNIKYNAMDLHQNGSYSLVFNSFEVVTEYDAFDCVKIEDWYNSFLQNKIKVQAATFITANVTEKLATNSKPIISDCLISFLFAKIDDKWYLGEFEPGQHTILETHINAKDPISLTRDFMNAMNSKDIDKLMGISYPLTLPKEDIESLFAQNGSQNLSFKEFKNKSMYLTDVNDSFNENFNLEVKFQNYAKLTVIFNKKIIKQNIKSSKEIALNLYYANIDNKWYLIKYDEAN